MALNDTGYLIPSRIVVWDAPVDTVAPTNSVGGLDAPTSPWAILAHVADETASGAPSLTRDGGDVTTKGSMTKRAIRTIVDPVTTGVDMDFTQLSRDTLKLYHSGTGGTTGGIFQVSSATDGGTTERAMLLVWEDGTSRVALYAPRVSWTGRDNIDTDSIEDAVKVPMHASFLDSSTLLAYDGKPLRYTWISPSNLLGLS